MPAVVEAPAVVRAPAPAPAPVRELDEAAADAAGLELLDVVLALGLPVAAASGAAADAASEPLRAATAAGQPTLLTLHQLRRTPPRWSPAPAGGVVFVCATPSVVAAVAVAGPPRAGRAPVPVVCLDAAAASGDADPAWPGDAVVAVLGQLRAAGWQLRLNGGGGPEGAVLTELLSSELDALPWRSTDVDPAVAATDPLAVAQPGSPLLRQLVADVRGA